jgi:hypothetical protein
MNLKDLVFGLMLTSAAYAQTKFIKEYPINVIVDSSSKNSSIENIVELSNNILAQADSNDYGIRIKYLEVLDTLAFKDTINSYDCLNYLRDNYNGKHVLYLTQSELVNNKGVSLSGAAFRPGSKLIVQCQTSDERTAIVLGHEFLHNIGLEDDETVKNIFNYYGENHLMNSSPLSLSRKINEKTKNAIWKCLENFKFYDFEVASYYNNVLPKNISKMNESTPANTKLKILRTTEKPKYLQ